MIEPRPMGSRDAAVSCRIMFIHSDGIASGVRLRDRQD